VREVAESLDIPGVEDQDFENIRKFSDMVDIGGTHISTEVGTSSTPTVVRHIADSLARRILSGEEGFQPGTRLRIMMLSDMFGASPTPIKEALRELHGQGIVVINPRKGATVASLSARDFDEITVLRVELELLALRLAGSGGFQAWILPELKMVVQKQAQALAKEDSADYFALDLRFHSLIAMASSNEYLASSYQDLTRRAAIRGAYLVESIEAMRESHAEHIEILEQLRDTDLGEASRLLREHADHARVRSGFVEAPRDR
jgi:DNA-binding GntR family transcriptional regulator